MRRYLLLSGDRECFTLLAFDNDNEVFSRRISLEFDRPAPANASWTQLYSTSGNLYRLIGLSEGEDKGLLYTFEIDRAARRCTLTSHQPTLGAPAHCTMLHDKSASALSTYLGGSIALYPVTATGADGLRLSGSPRSEMLPEFPYRDVVRDLDFTALASRFGTDPDRQRQCHVHQILERKSGFLFAPDLGSDRVWILERTQLQLQIRGWLQCPVRTGPRHAVFNHDETLIYVIGELSHLVHAFDLTQNVADNMLPLEGFEPNVIPPDIPEHHSAKMDAAEICTHPIIRNVLYVSNRWSKHIATHLPHLCDVPREQTDHGDSIAIIVLSTDGKIVEKTEWKSTKLDVIRGMRLSDNGQYMVVCGQEGGGCEIYEVKGTRGDELALVGAKTDLDNGIKHAVWL